jgi:hypothetical protein
LNNWSAVGIIFLLIGSVLLVTGVAQGLSAMNTINPLDQFLGSDYTSQLKGTLFVNAAGSYIAGSFICFVVGSFGLYMGNSKQDQIAATTIQYQPNQQETTVSKILCGSCWATNDIDAVFCKKCVALSFGKSGASAERKRRRELYPTATS